MSDLIKRETVQELVARRYRALTIYEKAFAATAAASDLFDQAQKTMAGVFNRTNSYNSHVTSQRRNSLNLINLPERDAFMSSAREVLDVDVWSHVMDLLDIDRLMDAQYKKKFRDALINNPPEATVDNIFATVQGLLANADTTFVRGIANVFSSLDRRFKSHDGWKIGDRVVITNVMCEYGTWNYHRHTRDYLTDIERIFFVLEKKEPPKGWMGIVQQIENDRKGICLTPTLSLTHGEYFRVRIFKNGNAHIWFERDDLLRKVNQLLGEYYNAGIPEEREAEETDPIKNIKTSIAKNYAFFATPEAVAHRVIRDAGLDSTYKIFRVLEPSAGNGNLASIAARNGHHVDCVEVHPERAKHLRSSGLYQRVIESDFLQVNPDESKLYDRVIMNPPFNRERDIDHIVHALKFLKPGGKLVAVMSAGTEFRNTKKSKAFRDLVEKNNGRFFDLPAGSFASVGTYCNTVILELTTR